MGSGGMRSGLRRYRFRDGPRGGGGGSSWRPPAEINTQIKEKTLAAAVRHFTANYKDADHEWSYVVDDQGFVYSYHEGDKGSVRAPMPADHRTSRWRRGGKREKDHSKARYTVLHNHPNGSAFSKTDLLTTASSNREKGIMAIGNKFAYSVRKGPGFKSDAFIKALKAAQPVGKDYDDAVHNWLTKNQRRFGYSYERVSTG